MRKAQIAQRFSALSDLSPILREQEVLALVKLSSSAWRKGVTLGYYPKPIRLGPRIRAWRKEDIAAFLRNGLGEGNERQ